MILVYLGFLNAKEMHGRDLFMRHGDWEKAVLNYSRDIVPKTVWNRESKMNGQPFAALIRSASVRLP